MGDQPRIQPPPRDKPDSTAEEPEDSLYARPEFEFDAATVTALLGLAIAFQFFVVANL